MSVSQVKLSTPGVTVPPLFFNKGTPTKGFSTGSCFLWLHEINVKFSTNVRGQVNHDYNRKLQEQGLATHSIPGGEDFQQLGMDTTTPIIRPDLYFQACQKVMTGLTNTPFAGLPLSTANFFDLLHQENVEYSANVRGLINQKYNQLLSEAGICAGRIPGDNLEQLGMDNGTSLRADLYLKAYEVVIVNFKASPLYSHCGPLQNIDNFQCAAQFMPRAAIYSCARVCKFWNTLVNDSSDMFKQFFIDEGIPFVESVNGKNDYKGEFLALYPRTISGRMIERLFGPIVGKLPLISRKCFEERLLEDPFEPGKLRKDTFEFVVIPDAFEGTCCAAFPYKVDDNGNLKGPLKLSECTEQKLTIPNKIGNLKILCEYPLEGRENMPVFGFFDPEVLKQCNTCSNKVNLVFMRTCIVGKNMGYLDQKAFVEKNGFQVISLIDRTFFDVVCILTSDTCPDATPHGSYARTFDSIDDVILDGSGVYQASMGNLGPGGVSVTLTDRDEISLSIGVVPGMPVEVPPPPALGTLAPDKGH